MKRLLSLAVLLPVLAVAQEPPKDEPKKEMPTEEIDVQKTAERIATNANKAGDRLKEKDVGQDTRKIQDDILKDIDALLRKAQQPPPMPPMNDMNPMMPPPPMKSDNPPPMMNMNMGGMNNQQPMPNPMKSMGGMGMGMPPMNMGGGNENKPQGSGSRRPKKDRRSEGDPMPMSGEPKKEPMGTNNPMPMPAKIDPKDGLDGKQEPMGPKEDPFGKTAPKRKDDQRFADLYKDVWGHLPDRLRQEMDLYYREQFMPRYSELLRQYYAAIAEQKKKGDGDR